MGAVLEMDLKIVELDKLAELYGNMARKADSIESLEYYLLKASEYNQLVDLALREKGKGEA